MRAPQKVTENRRDPPTEVALPVRKEHPPHGATQGEHRRARHRGLGHSRRAPITATDRCDLGCGEHNHNTTTQQQRTQTRSCAVLLLQKQLGRLMWAFAIEARTTRTERVRAAGCPAPRGTAGAGGTRNRRGTGAEHATSRRNMHRAPAPPRNRRGTCTWAGAVPRNRRGTPRNKSRNSARNGAPLMRGTSGGLKERDDHKCA
jgi:hypothetical protein